MIKGVINITGGPKQMIKALPAVMKEALKAALLHWHAKQLPKHFEPGAAYRYRYQRRSDKYRNRKLRQFGHDRPLVYTGNMMRQIMRIVSISGTSKVARAGLRGPHYLYAYQKSHGQADKAAEILRTTNAENRELAAATDRVIEQRMNALKAKETIRV